MGLWDYVNKRQRDFKAALCSCHLLLVFERRC
jgi:hypothetical protein